MSKPHEVLREYRQKRQLSCAAMGKLIGVAESTVRSFENANRPITPERAVEIERATGGAVRRHELRPDLYPAHDGQDRRAGEAAA